MAEMERRREKQIAFNKEHGIKPQTIVKEVRGIMEGARVTPGGPKRGKRAASGVDKLEIPEDPKALGKLMTKLEKQMLDHAQNLEFEEAAKLRDQLAQIRDAQLKV